MASTSTPTIAAYIASGQRCISPSCLNARRRELRRPRKVWRKSEEMATVFSETFAVSTTSCTALRPRLQPGEAEQIGRSIRRDSAPHNASELISRNADIRNLDEAKQREFAVGNT